MLVDHQRGEGADCLGPGLLPNDLLPLWAEGRGHHPRKRKGKQREEEEMGT